MRYSKKLYVIMLLCSVFLTFVQAQKFWEATSKREQELSTLYAERIQSVAHEIVDNGRILQEVFALFPGALTEERFMDVARIVFNPQYYIFISYQPKGVVQYIYPKEDFSWIVGRDILEYTHSRIDAQYARYSGRTILAGPYKTGNLEAIVARRPVFEFVDNERKFWGFISVGFDVEKMLREVIEIDALTAFSYEYGIYTVYQGEYIEVGRSANFEKDEDSKRVFTVGDQTWILHLYDKGKLTQLFLVILSFFVGYSGLSTIMFCIVNKFEQKHINAKKLTFLDALTKAYNRKMVDEYIQQNKLGTADAFTLFYMDLNDFKPVNDTHGHEVGDKLLIAFVERMRHSFKADSVVARMGGDEFVLILKQDFSEKALGKIIERIEALSQRQFYLDGIEVNISSSIGYGQYPKDGTTMVDILAEADERMYAWKKRIKAERAARGEPVSQR